MPAISVVIHISDKLPCFCSTILSYLFNLILFWCFFSQSRYAVCWRTQSWCASMPDTDGAESPDISTFFYQTWHKHINWKTVRASNPNPNIWLLKPLLVTYLWLLSAGERHSASLASVTEGWCVRGLVITPSKSQHTQRHVALQFLLQPFSLSERY